ncbi:50S ribosomal protein L10 [Plasmodium gonderi]|uniref:50S ribosomal protein L10 n=1 Tax=Plasmodium gonderi TaxID=77519 RepID=A0A1Y1JEW8_PLAGO|nr:50S ribosomal protein L10 [Plasmodium gonderi]GAW79757.1 50S ribosomal protein L10 [Plasmodium gonderi]
MHSPYAPNITCAKRGSIKCLSLALLMYFLYTTFMCINYIDKNFEWNYKSDEAKVVPFILSARAALIKAKGEGTFWSRKYAYPYFLNNRSVYYKKNGRDTCLHSRKCSGYRNTREGKDETIRKIKRILKVTKLLIQLNSFKLTPNMRMDLLINLPRPHVRVHMVKNTLMKLAVQKTPFEAIIPYLKESNMYMFIMNENYISFTLYGNKMFSSLYKEYKTNNFIKLSVFENTILNKTETENLINLKSYSYYFGHVVNRINKIISDIPTSIMQIPASIARGIYLHTQKEKDT